jgi:hypothetical protein
MKMMVYVYNNISIAQEAIILSMFVEVNNGDSKNTN